MFTTFKTIFWGFIKFSIKQIGSTYVRAINAKYFVKALSFCQFYTFLLSLNESEHLKKRNFKLAWIQKVEWHHLGHRLSFAAN